jgi:hypothetical protein
MLRTAGISHEARSNQATDRALHSRPLEGNDDDGRTSPRGQHFDYASTARRHAGCCSMGVTDLVSIGGHRHDHCVADVVAGSQTQPRRPATANGAGKGRSPITAIAAHPPAVASGHLNGRGDSSGLVCPSGRSRPTRSFSPLPHPTGQSGAVGATTLCCWPCTTSQRTRT